MAFNVLNNSEMLKLVLILALNIFKPQDIQLVDSCSHAAVPKKAYKTKTGKSFWGHLF